MHLSKHLIIQNTMIIQSSKKWSNEFQKTWSDLNPIFQLAKSYFSIYNLIPIGKCVYSKTHLFEKYNYRLLTNWVSSILQELSFSYKSSNIRRETISILINFNSYYKQYNYLKQIQLENNSPFENKEYGKLIFSKISSFSKWYNLWNPLTKLIFEKQRM